MKKTTEQLYRQRILRVQMYIQKNLDRELSLEELAQKSHFSVYHFHRIFKAFVGESLKEHIRRLRLEGAASQLKYTDESVIDIAFDAGYQTHEAFTRAFKANFGCSPSGFRNNCSTSQRILAKYQNDRQVKKRDKNQVNGDEIMEVKIQDIEPMRVAFVRHVGPYHQAGKAWEKLCTHLGKEGYLGPNCKFIGICYDDPEVTPAEKIRYDACITVDENFVQEEEIAVQTIGGGEYAVTTHFGPYDNLSQTYSRFFRDWLINSDREISQDPCMEFYLNDPESTDPEDLLTDVCLPLKPKR
jgi:AraC family transcriptional regulator